MSSSLLDESKYTGERLRWSHGGHLEEISKPHTRFFPNPYRKRKVTVTISRYYGIGLHYYVSLQEEDNPIWNGEAWQTAWDDKEGRGRTDTDLFFGGEIEANIRVEAYEIAVGKAMMLIKKYFPDHEVVWEDYCKDYEGEDF